MPRFHTPEPISAVIELSASNVHISAGEHLETVVEVRPSDGARRADVSAAEQTRVEYASGRLLVKATARWRAWSPFGYGGSVDVDVELPAGSQVTGASSMGTFRCTGALGDCRIKTSAGEIHVEHATAAKLATAAGDIRVEQVTGDAEMVTASGDVRAEEIGGTAVVKNSNGDVRVGEVGGEVSVKAANGDIAIERPGGSVSAKTANGDIRVAAARRGAVVAETGFGGVEISILEGTAAWLDLHTGYGQLHNDLDDAEPPQAGADTVEVHARTGYGDITIRRCSPVAWIEPAR